MRDVGACIAACWVGLGVVWLVLALGAKPSVPAPRRAWRRAARAIGFVIVALLVLRLRGGRAVAFPPGPAPARAWAGVALCALGVGVAVWARIVLGRNWGIPMSRRREPELVTGGPYRLVRHPIYSGILLAMLGSALAAGVLWIVPLVLGAGYFLYSARREEAFMAQRFPDRYKAYRRRTKLLIPFLL